MFFNFNSCETCIIYLDEDQIEFFDFPKTAHVQETVT
jgi:hypothetical protein